MEIRRAYDTSDDKDYVFELDKEFSMAWAVHSSSTSFKAMHLASRGLETMLKSDGTAAVPSDEGVASDSHDHDHDHEGHSSHDENNDRAVVTMATMGAALTLATVLTL